MAKDVVIVVQRDALPTEKESLDFLLISTTGAVPVDTYRDLEVVKSVFGDDGPHPNSKVVRKAATLMNQGKTTLAETLVNKFKIVGFEPPSSVPALPATLTGVFSEGSLEENIPAGVDLWVKVGGDDSVVIHVKTTAEVKTGAKLAALFAGTSFTKGGKTYTATVSGCTVTYTATETGATDSIPEQVNVYLDEARTTEVTTNIPAMTFTNGRNALSAPDALIEAIKQFQQDVDNDWYYFLTDRDEPEYVKALARFAEASEPSEAELGAGVEDHRKFYMGQTSDKKFRCDAARAAVIYTDAEYLSEEPDASYTGNVGPFYPRSVTWKFKRPQDGNAPSSAGAKLITLPKLTDGEREALTEQHVNYLTEEYKRQYVKEGVCLNGEFIDTVLGSDWIAKRMRDLLYDILTTNASVDYSDAGFGLIATAVLQALMEASDDEHGIIARDQETKAGIFSVSIPKYSESTETQRLNRQMPDITWEALLSGSIHSVKTKGVLRATL